MNWRLKAFVQGTISLLPWSTEINYVFQRYVTRNIPPTDSAMRHALNIVLRDFAVIREHLAVPVVKARCFEFGAGATFLGPLTFYCLGVENQTLVDIHRLLRPELVNRTIHFLCKQKDVEFIRKPLQILDMSLKGQRMIDWLKDTYGINYLAPCDARYTPFAAESFDLITSSAVFEHVPKTDIEAIMKECKRILRGDGIMASRIDYQDHYSYCDPKVSAFQFLQYTDAQWRKYSPSLNFTNRLRHRDFIELTNAASFEILADARVRLLKKTWWL